MTEGIRDNTLKVTTLFLIKKNKTTFSQNIKGINEGKKL
jgi:hypothetical protein